ncbi:MAG: [FeFe] hydrogenase H-cluster maturation GTPase HydF [Bacteroidales bacterium]|jgi:[FeFe] hydrogenase H-cluster maturation GTPase HydF|nr:[FeFe] hydrogenase H-cluster maturation GTPase HydF [Bacteroidales bacterium]
MKTKRVYIGIFGRRNTGKSSLINAIAKQDIAIVSPQAGTTTDPVKKSIEIFGIGPVVLVDTAGLDDEGDLGIKRVQKTREVLKNIDVAIILFADNLWGKMEQEIVRQLFSLQIPYLILHNKSDKTPLSDFLKKELHNKDVPLLESSAATGTGIDELINKLVEITPPTAYTAKTLIGDIISKGSLVLLVMPQDDEAPEGRLILPQVQLIRDILDNNAIAVGLQPDELADYLDKQTPDLVITDSQAFEKVAKIVAPAIPLTSFSIVLARTKGHFDHYLTDTAHLNKLQDGDTVLMLESCTHPVSCEDIGRNKLPNLILRFTGKQIRFEFIAGLSPVNSPEKYAMAIQCGGCMVTDKQLHNRIQLLIDANIPVTNYGMAIAFLTGIFDRVTAVFRK